jgi:8-oxo-dGTP diphosphatase
MDEAAYAVTRVVGAAVIRDGRVLAARRSKPHSLAGLWEFPGGKVEPGESEVEALRRECREELGIDVVVGDRVGPDVNSSDGRAVVRIYVASAAGTPKPLDHAELRWLAADELDDVPWLPADQPVVEALRPLLRRTDPA